MFVLVPTFATSTELSPLWQEFVGLVGVLGSSELHQQLLPLKIIFVLSGAAFIFIFLFLLLRTKWIAWTAYSDIMDFLTASKKLMGITNQKNLQAWNKIKKGLEKNYEAQWKVSLIEAVSFFEEILKNAGYAGENFRERLDKLSPDDISNIDRLIKADEIYHDIISDPNYRLNKDKAHEVVTDIEQTLTQMEFF